ncbi:hypothetical protein PMIN03_001693 [Paraphaeosphaeria minitans]
MVFSRPQERCCASDKERHLKSLHKTVPGSKTLSRALTTNTSFSRSATRRIPSSFSSICSSSPTSLPSRRIIRSQMAIICSICWDLWYIVVILAPGDAPRCTVCERFAVRACLQDNPVHRFCGIGASRIVVQSRERANRGQESKQYELSNPLLYSRNQQRPVGDTACGCALLPRAIEVLQAVSSHGPHDPFVPHFRWCFRRNDSCVQGRRRIASKRICQNPRYLAGPRHGTDQPDAGGDHLTYRYIILSLTEQSGNDSSILLLISSLFYI